MKQIADEIRVSKQAVWQRIKRNAELTAMFESHSETINGRIYVDELLEQHLKKLYSGRQHVDETSTCVDDNLSHVDGTVDEVSTNVDVNLSYVDENIDEASTNVDVNLSHVDEIIDEASTNVDANLFYVDKVSTNVDRNLSRVDVNTLIATLQNTVDTLQQQLTVKDNQIIELTSMLKASQEQQATLVTALSAAQALHAGTIKERLTDRSESAEKQGEASIMKATPEDKQEPQKRKKFFARIFGRY